MVRSGVLTQATLGGKHLSAPQVLAPRGDPLRETRLNLPRFLNTRVLNRLHPTPINQHALAPYYLLMGRLSFTRRMKSRITGLLRTKAKHFRRTILGMLVKDTGSTDPLATMTDALLNLRL